MEPITDLTELLDTIHYFGISYEIEVKNWQTHVIISDHLGNRVAQFIFDKDDAFKFVFKS